jgi:UDP-N-acetylmuramoylalanine-D-glutamate ligase
MSESKQRRLAPSSENTGTIVLAKFPKENLSRFGAVVWVLWPDDPGAHLAKLAKCTKRHANLLIAGKRKPNARAAHAVLGEIIG